MIPICSSKNHHIFESITIRTWSSLSFISERFRNGRVCSPVFLEKNLLKGDDPTQIGIFPGIHGDSWYFLATSEGDFRPTLPDLTSSTGVFLLSWVAFFAQWTRQLKSQIMDSIFFFTIFSGWPTIPKSCETTFPPKFTCMYLYTAMFKSESSRISSIFMASEATSTRNRVLPLVFQIPGAQTPLEALRYPSNSSQGMTGGFWHD